MYKEVWLKVNRTYYILITFQESNIVLYYYSIKTWNIHLAFMPYLLLLLIDGYRNYTSVSIVVDGSYTYTVYTLTCFSTFRSTTHNLNHIYNII